MTDVGSHRLQEGRYGHSPDFIHGPAFRQIMFAHHSPLRARAPIKPGEPLSRFARRRSFRNRSQSGAVPSMCYVDKLCVLPALNFCGQPRAVIIDSQSVKSTEVSEERDYDVGKKTNGRKRHVLVGTSLLLLALSRPIRGLMAGVK